MSTDQLTQAAIALPEDERRELIRTLIATLPAEEDEPTPETDPAFFAELRRRDEEMESGRVKGHSREEMMAIARKALRCD